MPSQAETSVGEFLVLFAVKKYMTPRAKAANDGHSLAEDG